MIETKHWVSILGSGETWIPSANFKLHREVAIKRTPEQRQKYAEFARKGWEKRKLLA